ncbi:MAG: hypothetical protein M1608_09830 [Candidatus Omnitrophica bacterium]|nr:hypothetical protein [Candidatus Omnitrophota bacterium]
MKASPGRWLCGTNCIHVELCVYDAAYLELALRRGGQAGFPRQDLAGDAKQLKLRVLTKELPEES